jgi:hypothetical protein
MSAVRPWQKCGSRTLENNPTCWQASSNLVTDGRAGTFHTNDAQGLLNLRVIWQGLDMPYGTVGWLGKDGRNGADFHDYHRNFKGLS